MEKPAVFIIDRQEPALATSQLLATYGYVTVRYGSAADFFWHYRSPAPGCLVANAKRVDAIAFVSHLKRRRIELPLILVSERGEVSTAVAAIKAGAFDVLELPLNDVPLIASLNRGLARNFAWHERNLSRQELYRRFGRLTSREIAVFDLAAQGLTSRNIGKKLGLSPRTVESHRSALIAKMQANSPAELVRQAIDLGRVSLPIQQQRGSLD